MLGLLQDRAAMRGLDVARAARVGKVGFLARIEVMFLIFGFGGRCAGRRRFYLAPPALVVLHVRVVVQFFAADHFAEDFGEAFGQDRGGNRVDLGVADRSGDAEFV